LIDICQQINTKVQSIAPELGLTNFNNLETAKLNHFIKFVEAKEQKRFHTEQGGKQYRIQGTAPPALKLFHSPPKLSFSKVSGMGSSSKKLPLTSTAGVTI
jgi:hypothetical protein